MDKGALVYNLRVWFKSGPLRGSYAKVRRLKRRIREDVTDDAPLLLPLPAEQVRPEVASFPDEPRLYFSLALAYLNNSPLDALRALACLRCAETLGFPSAERVLLYKAVCLSRLGDRSAVTQVSGLPSYEFTSEENELRAALLSASPTVSPTGEPNGWQALSADVARLDPASLFVAGDNRAVSAVWAPGARYVLAEEAVTGLSANACARLPLTFALGVAPRSCQAGFIAAGVQCAVWLAPDTEMTERTEMTEMAGATT